MNEARSIGHRLTELGLTLPQVAAPLAAYVPAVRTGSYVWTAGQLPFVDGVLQVTGKVGHGPGLVDPAVAAEQAAVSVLNALAAVAAGVDVPVAHRAGRNADGEGAALPFVMEDGLVRFGRDRPKAHLSAEVVRSVHGTVTSPVPIMLSRVTIAARRSSSQASVPAGRSGMTM